MTVKILIGDTRDRLRDIPDCSIQCCVTSPPYFGLRDYGTPGQIGLEPTLAEYVAALVDVFRSVRRVLRDDGTVFLNLGDSYAGGKMGRDDDGPEDLARRAALYNTGVRKAGAKGKNGVQRKPTDGLKPKDLMMVPARVAIALQDDGWWLRSHIIWVKKAPMPESVTDRPTSAHESIFLLTKSARYFWDQEAVREEAASADREFSGNKANPITAYPGNPQSYSDGPSGFGVNGNGRNLRNVWTLGPEPFADAHFATFPTEIPRRCIKAGSRSGDTILDPFGGSGTTGLVADQLERHAILIELNPAYAALAERRIHGDAPLFTTVDVA